MSEYTEVEKPFLRQLAEQGWTIIDQGPTVPQDAAPSLRGNFREWLLPSVFDAAVRDINRTGNGEAWLTDRQLEDLRSQLLRQPNRTLLEANEAVQALLFKAQVNVNETTGESDPVVKLIDFRTPENNRFHAINQFRIDTSGCVRGFMIPDIVLFVNGIPLGVVECKKGSETCATPMQESFVQLQRYMRKRKETELAGLQEGEPRLFHSNLLLIRSSGTQADYGTITSGEEHFYAWKTLYPHDDAAREGLNGQQQLIAGMLTRSNLLQILRTSAVFMDTDGGPRIKVVCRYQQFRATNKILERLRKGSTATARSGVVWHTQGSGKSLTMVFLARLLRSSADLNDYKIVLVNDRTDLEDQLGETATLIGGRVNVIESRQDLRRHLATDSSDINMVMVHKFQERKETLSNTVAEALGTYLAMPSGKTFGAVNTSDRIILLIDEAHRTQSSDLGENLFEAFPNATRIAFTGTPLLTERHGEKKTHKRFGEYIDTYRLMDSVNDGATLQILYEGRTADSALNEKHAFDEAFEDLFKERTAEELQAIKKKYGATGDILEAENRINAIARDLVKHYIDNILPNGFKAQVVCHSKLACVRYRSGIKAALAERIAREQERALPDAELIKRLAFLKTAVVISSDGTNEAAFITHARKEAARLKAVDNFCKPFNLEDPDKEDTGIAFLIVCDRLLTGFDAPIEQVMYIDKKLRETPAQPYRVPAKRFGYILQVAKERYKDASLDLGDAGEKVKALINEHLISLGINPKVEPVELLAPDFLEKLAAHSGRNDEAKASEMEHAIRKHCTVHHDEDPAFFKSLSAKVDALIEKHHDEWDLLAEKLAELRNEAIVGRQKGEDGMSREATTFYAHIIQVGFASGTLDDDLKPPFKALLEAVVELLQETIGSIDFWQNPDKQKRVRGLIKTEIAKAGLEELKKNRERVAVEIMKLAKNRHDELTRGGQLRGA